MLTIDDDLANEIRYARYTDSNRAMLFVSASDRDDYVSRHAAVGYPIEAITACQAFKMTPPEEDGSRVFLAPHLFNYVRER